MGAAAAACAPIADRVLYAVVLFVVAVARALRAMRRALALAPAWLHRAVAGGGLIAGAAYMDDTARRRQTGDAPRVPSHIALAGALRSTADVARIARHAREAGASIVSAHLCGCLGAGVSPGVAGALGACGGTRRSGHHAGFESLDHAPCTVVLSTADALSVIPPTKPCNEQQLQRRQRNMSLLPGTGPIIGAGAAALVEAARWLAATRPCDRGVDVTDPYALVDWLDRDMCGLMLPSEPDVLIVFLDDHGLRTLHGFPPWQLRLTQICFVEECISSFTQDDLLRVACPAAAAPKRFGT
jgi:hypothetical protein